jgi:hypothetical protein
MRSLRIYRAVSKLYVETSVINGPLSRDLRLALVSSAFWDKVRAGELEAHISSYVLFELGKTSDGKKRDKLLDIASLCTSDAPSGVEVEELAREYVRRGMIPEKYVFDAYHIASASLGKFEALVTWNFEHMLSERTERLLEMINREKNIYIPRVRSPEVYLW